MFSKKGYPEKTSMKPLLNIVILIIIRILFPRRRQTKINALPFLVSLQPLATIKKIIQRIWNILRCNPVLADQLPPQPSVDFKKANCIKTV